MKKNAGIMVQSVLLFVICLEINQNNVFAQKCPCDIYADGGTPCVGAYSTVRALYSTFNGPLYQVKRASDNTTKDIGVLSPGGFANAAAQDSFCTGACIISIIYDQSPQGNDLPVSPPVYWLKNGGKGSDAKAAKITVGGHGVYGVKGVAGQANTYRNNNTKGVATGDQSESMYMVVDSKLSSMGCCYDFGNVETTGNADGRGAMETIYWGQGDNTWGKGGGTGPWLLADLELGIFGSNKKNDASVATVKYPAFATLLLTGTSGTHYALKHGDAQSGTLFTQWNGARPSGYNPMKKQGAIVLGAGGDGSNGGTGTFFEGAITSGSPTDAVDNAVQASIVAAGYGKNTVSVYKSDLLDKKNIYSFRTDYNSSNSKVAIRYALQDKRKVSIHVVDVKGHSFADIHNGIMTSGNHATEWNTAHVPAGVYLYRVLFDGLENCAGKIIIGR